MRAMWAAMAMICALANMFAASLHAESSPQDADAHTESGDDPRREWLDRVDEARRRYDAFAESVRLARQTEDASSSRASHLGDSTLRAGDIVVTETGLLLFTGAPTWPHDVCEFEHIGERRARALPHRNALLEILRAIRRGAASP